MSELNTETTGAVGPDRSQAKAGEEAFSHAIRSLPDDALAGPSLLPGWSRAFLVAHVASNAAAFTRAIDGALQGGDTRMYVDRAARDAQIEEVSALPATELRVRSDHSASLLEAVWSGLSSEQWALDFTNGQGKQVPLTASVKARAREVWVHLVDLDAGVGFEALPPQITEAVLREVWASWQARGVDTGLAVTTTASDGASLTLGAAESEDTTLLSGSLAQITGWATGRVKPGADHILAHPELAPSATRDGSPTELPPAPDWI